MHDDAVQHLKRADKKMAAHIRRTGPCELTVRKRAVFRALVQAVTHQQLNGKAAETILRRFIALFPGKAFPTPEDILKTRTLRLRSAGLSRAKAAAIQDIAARQLDGTIPSPAQTKKLSDAELVERLTVIRGVGPWTVEMLLIFTLGRMDVWPVSDFGVRKGYSRVYGLKEMPEPRTLAALGESFRPYRSVAAWYFWRAADA